MGGGVGAMMVALECECECRESCERGACECIILVGVGVSGPPEDQPAVSPCPPREFIRDSSGG